MGLVTFSWFSTISSWLGGLELLEVKGWYESGCLGRWYTYIWGWGVWWKGKIFNVGWYGSGIDYLRRQQDLGFFSILFLLALLAVPFMIAEVDSLDVAFTKEDCTGNAKLSDQFQFERDLIDGALSQTPRLWFLPSLY